MQSALNLLARGDHNMTTLKQLITANSTGITGNYEAIAARLNAPTSIANPVTAAPQVAAPVSLKQVMALVPAAEMVQVYKIMPQLIPDLRNAIDNNDREYMAVLLTIAATATVISAATVTKLQTLLGSTVADPSWSATVAGPSLASAAGLGTVTAAMVQRELN